MADALPILTPILLPRFRSAANAVDVRLSQRNDEWALTWRYERLTDDFERAVETSLVTAKVGSLGLLLLEGATIPVRVVRVERSATLTGGIMAWPDMVRIAWPNSALVGWADSASRTNLTGHAIIIASDDPLRAGDLDVDSFQLDLSKESLESLVQSYLTGYRVLQVPALQNTFIGDPPERVESPRIWLRITRLERTKRNRFRASLQLVLATDNADDAVTQSAVLVQLMERCTRSGAFWDIGLVSLEAADTVFRASHVTTTMRFRIEATRGF